MSRWVHERIRAVFFDAVGTLIFPDPPAAEVYAGVALRHGLKLDSELIRKRFIESFNAEEAFDREHDWVTSEEREVERPEDSHEYGLPAALGRGQLGEGAGYGIVGLREQLEPAHERVGLLRA